MLMVMAVEIDTKESGLVEQDVKDSLPDFARDLLINGAEAEDISLALKGSNMDLKQMVKKERGKMKNNRWKPYRKLKRYSAFFFMTGKRIFKGKGQAEQTKDKTEIHLHTV